jgi:hypothetical protein
MKAGSVSTELRSNIKIRLSFHKITHSITLFLFCSQFSTIRSRTKSRRGQFQKRTERYHSFF